MNSNKNSNLEDFNFLCEKGKNNENFFNLCKNIISIY